MTFFEDQNALVVFPLGFSMKIPCICEHPFPFKSIGFKDKSLLSSAGIHLKHKIAFCAKNLPMVGTKYFVLRRSRNILFAEHFDFIGIGR